jgi:PAS domain-containing protein
MVIRFMVDEEPDLLTLVNRLRNIGGIDTGLVEEIYTLSFNLQQQVKELTHIRSSLLNARGKDISTDYTCPAFDLRGSLPAGIIAPPAPAGVVASPFYDIVLFLNDAFLLFYGFTEEEIRQNRERILLLYDEREGEDKENALIGRDYVCFFRGFKEGFGENIREYFKTVKRQTELVYIRDGCGEYHELVLDKAPIFCPKKFRTAVPGKIHLYTIFNLSPPDKKMEGVSRELEGILEKERAKNP